MASKDDAGIFADPEIFFHSPLEAADFLLKSFPLSVNVKFLPDDSEQPIEAMCH